MADDDEAAQEILRLFAEQIFLLRYEITLNPELDIVALQDTALQDLVAYGAISYENGDINILHRDRIGELAELTRNWLESSWLTLRGANAMRTRDLDATGLTKALQELGKDLLAVEDLRRTESLSMVNLRNCIRAFREEGVISFRSDGNGLELDDVVLEGHIADLKQLLV